ncbi:MAG: type II toxin-antitoxin system HicA family toxin [Chitinophagaceae bacterium]
MVAFSLPLNMKASEVIKLLKADGWYQERQKGSHKIFKHATKTGIVVVPDHSPKDIPPGTLNSILKQAGLK